MSASSIRNLRTAATALAIAVAGVAMVGCTTTRPDDKASSMSSRQSIDAETTAALSKLYNSVPGSRQLVSQAKGVLIFPSVIGASLGVGAEYGRGSLRVGNMTSGYYSTTAGSIGFQAGAQSKAVVYLFMTQESLDKFRASKGWTVGADATVAVANVGANGSIDSQTVRQPIVGFVMTNVGLEAGVSLSGSKISPIQP